MPGAVHRTFSSGSGRLPSSMPLGQVHLASFQNAPYGSYLPLLVGSELPLNISQSPKHRHPSSFIWVGHRPFIAPSARPSSPNSAAYVQSICPSFPRKQGLVVDFSSPCLGKTLSSVNFFAPTLEQSLTSEDTNPDIYPSIPPVRS